MKLVYNDETHAYWLDSRRCKGITTLANIPDDKYRIQQSEKRRVTVGLASSPKLMEKAAANIDNWDVLDVIIEAAKEVGGAHEGRDRGINAHTITERHDLGKFVVDTPLSAEIIPNWQKLIDAAGLTILPEYVERMVLYPDRFLAGRLDRIVQLADGRLAILDVKGGKWAKAYPHSICIQLALYAHAPLIARDPRRVKEHTVETDEFDPMPDVDQEWALVAHFPEDGPPELLDFDIRAGWKAAELLCFNTLKWRDKKGLVRPHRLLPVGLRPAPAPAWSPPDEGVALTAPDLDGLRLEFKASPDQTRVNAWLVESVAAHRSFNPAQNQSHRRRQIIRAAIAWAPFEDDIVRAALALVLGTDLQPGTTIGCALGSLTIDEASRLHYFGQQLDTGGLLLTFSEDGTPLLVDAQPTAV